jgi:hypothetical protein
MPDGVPASAVHVLDGVLTVRTSEVGHERLSRFFAQFRGMQDGR